MLRLKPILLKKSGIKYLDKAILIESVKITRNTKQLFK
jgi:hypothetical protein